MDEFCKEVKGKWEFAGIYSMDDLDAMWGETRKGVPRRRLKCPTCGRRITSSIEYADCGCHYRHNIPRHRSRKSRFQKRIRRTKGK